MTMTPPIRILLVTVLYYLGFAVPNINCWSGYYSCCCYALSIQHTPTADYRRRFHGGYPYPTSSSASSSSSVLLSRQQLSRIGFVTQCYRRDRSSSTRVSTSLVHHAHQFLTSSSSSEVDGDNSVDATNCRSHINQQRLKWWKAVHNPINHLPRSARSYVDDELNNDAVEQQTRNLGNNSNIHAASSFNNGFHQLHSVALLASCRRLSFLFLSIMMVNFVRSTILKVSSSHNS